MSDIPTNPYAIVEKLEKRVAELEGGNTALIKWAVSRWVAEISNRPLINVHRAGVDATWRQVIKHLGGDPEKLLGPDHWDLVAADPNYRCAEQDDLDELDLLRQRIKELEAALVADMTQEAQQRGEYDESKNV